MTTLTRPYFEQIDVRCLRCGECRFVTDLTNDALDVCGVCGYIGWALSVDVTNAEARVLQLSHLPSGR